MSSEVSKERRQVFDEASADLQSVGGELTAEVDAFNKASKYWTLQFIFSNPWYELRAKLKPQKKYSRYLAVERKEFDNFVDDLSQTFHISIQSLKDFDGYALTYEITPIREKTHFMYQFVTHKPKNSA